MKICPHIKKSSTPSSIHSHSFTSPSLISITLNDPKSFCEPPLIGTFLLISTPSIKGVFTRQKP